MKITTAELAAIALGDDGQDYAKFSILDGDHWIERPEGNVYVFRDESALLDCDGGGWDVATLCPQCGTWGWVSVDECHHCRNNG